MSFIRDQCAIMSQLQIDMAREFASVPPPLSPSPLPKSNAQEAHPSNQGGGDSILVNSIFPDEE